MLKLLNRKELKTMFGMLEQYRLLFLHQMKASGATNKR